MATVKKIKKAQSGKVPKYQNAPAPIPASDSNKVKKADVYKANKATLNSAGKKNMNILDEMISISQPKLKPIQSNDYRPSAPKQKTGGKITKAKTGAKVKDKKWIQKAIKKPGALRAQLGAKPGQPIPAGKLAAAAKKPGKLGQRARLAQTLKKMKKK